MREYLFRGKRKDNGEWVEGYLYITHNGVYEIGCYNTQMNIERWTFEVDPATVGQFTGLMDKNGKRIFEGDIVRDVDTGNIRTVEYHRNRFVFVSLLRHFFDVIYEEDWEVIGNIHDNPELEGEVV